MFKYNKFNNLLMIDAYKHFWTKAFDFKGVSTRSQFWWSYLATTILYFALTIVSFIGYALNEWIGTILSLLLGLFILGIIIPSISICIRRTRDAGKAWPWIFINLVPFGGIYYIVLLCQPSLPIG